MKHNHREALSSAAASNPRARLLAWALWAAVVLGLYYVQLWRALVSAQGIEPVALVSAAKHLAALFGAAFAIGAISVLAGAVVERLLGWPRLAPGLTLLRRAVSGLVLMLVVLGPVHAYVGMAVQGMAGGVVPFAGEAASRALFGGFGLVAVVSAAFPAGQMLCGWLGWRADDWRDEVLYCTSIGLGIVAAACGTLALAGLFRPLAIQAAIALLIVVGLPRLWATVQRAGRWSPDEQGAHRRWFVRGLQIVSASALVMAALTALAPETEYDALWYHLGLPKLWLEAGRPVDLVHEFVALYPLTWELVFTAGLVAGGPVAAKLLHFICLPLGALLAWQLSSVLAPRAEPWVAVALFVTVPTVLWEATTTYVDLALALHIGLGVLALLHYAEGRGRGWFGVAVVSLGLALATKHLALVALAILAPGLVLWLWRRERRPLRISLKPAALLVVLALLTATPWYARSYLASGNPFFPELFGVFGASPAERWDANAEEQLARFKDRFGVARTPWTLLLLPWDVTMHAARYGGSLGPLFLVLLPALALFRGVSPRLTWASWFVALFVVVWASPISSFQLRFLVVITPLLAVLGAESVQRLAAASPAAASRGLAAALLALLTLNLPPFTRFHERDRVGWDGWLTHVVHDLPLGVNLGRESEDDYVARRVSTYRAWQFVNRAAAQDARVLTFRGGDHYYSERQRISSVAPMARAAVWRPPGEEAEALRELRALGVTHILTDRQSLETEADRVALFSERMRGDALELQYEDGRALVFRVR